MHGRRHRVEPYRACDHAVVRHDDHVRRAHVALDGFADGERRALPARQPHHTRATEGGILTAEPRNSPNVLAVEHGLVVSDHALLALAALAHLETVAHDELLAACEPSVAIQ